MPQRIVLIGRSGQVAQSLAARLAADGHELTFLSRPEYDLANGAQELARAIVAAKPDVVINPAAYTAVDRAEDEPEAAYALNVRGAEAVARAAAEANAAIIHFSTDYVFDGALSRPYVETDAAAPLNVYGATKLAGEHAVAAANARHIIVRTSWVYSPFGTNFVKTMLRLAAERPSLRVIDDQHGAPTSALDLSDTVARILPRIGSADSADVAGLYHLSGTGSTTWCAFAREILKQGALRGHRTVPVEAITTADFHAKAQRPANSSLSCAKFERTFGWALPAWQQSLSQCLDALIGPK